LHQTHTHLSPIMFSYYRQHKSITHSQSRRLRTFSDHLCQSCGGDIFVEDWKQGDMICSSCGEVKEAHLVSPDEEHRNFADSGEDRHRTTAVNPLLDDSLSTTSTAVDSKCKEDSRIVNRIQQRMCTPKDRNMKLACGKIEEFSNRMDLPEKFKDTAKELFLDYEKSREKCSQCQTDGIIAAVLYLACKKEGYPRTLKKISAETQVTEKKMRIALQLMGSKQEPMPAEDLVPWICSQLKLDYNYVSLAKKMAREAVKYVEGKHPDSIASACVFIVCSKFGLSVRDNDIADSAMVAVSTLRNLVRDLTPHIPVLFIESN